MLAFDISAKYYPSGGSSCLTVTLKFGADHQLQVMNSDGVLLHQLNLDDVKVKPQLGSIPRELITPDSSLLVVESNNDVNAWLANSHSDSPVFKWENSKKSVLFSLLLVPACLFGIFKYLIPASAVIFAEYVPYAAVKVASEHTLIALDKTLLSPSQLAQDQTGPHLDNWAQIIEKIGLKSEQFRIEFRDSEKMGANAFALPDGTIVVTDQLVELVENNQDLLTSILLHEIGHVQHKHSMRLISETLATSLAVSYFFADLGGLVEFFAGISNTVMQNQFSQKLEWEADNYALEKMDQLGMDRENFALAMEKFASSLPAESNIQVLLQSHPLMKDRIDNARKNRSEE